jgi:hypothetical protein
LTSTLWPKTACAVTAPEMASDWPIAVAMSTSLGALSPAGGEMAKRKVCVN